MEERIDHRSFADQGKDDQPTIHEGVAARAMEKKGIVSDRCELNRQIKRDNALLRQLKAEFQKLVKAVQDSIPALAQAMEELRANMIVFAYQVLHTGKRIKALTLDIDTDTPHIRKHDELSSQIREKQKELKALNDKKAKTSFFQPVEHVRLNAKFNETLDEIKRLKSEKARETGLIGVADDAGVQRAKAMLEKNLNSRQAEQTVLARSKINLGLATQEFHDLEAQASEFDPDELMGARLALRPEEESRAASTLKENYTWQYDADTMNRAKADVAKLLGEESEVTKPRSLRENLRQKQKEVQQRELPKRKKAKEWER